MTCCWAAQQRLVDSLPGPEPPIHTSQELARNCLQNSVPQTPVHTPRPEADQPARCVPSKVPSLKPPRPNSPPLHTPLLRPPEGPGAKAWPGLAQLRVVRSFGSGFGQLHLIIHTYLMRDQMPLKAALTAACKAALTVAPTHPQLPVSAQPATPPPRLRLGPPSGISRCHAGISRCLP